MSQKLKAALIGCGGMGSMHNAVLKALSEEMNVEMVAIADIRQEFLEKGASGWPGVHTYRTGMELLERETLDFVYICLPSYLHAEHAVAAMRRGCHVFIEKPVCLTEEDCARLIKTQKETGVKVMAGQVVRFFPEYEYLKKVYEEQSLGKLKSLVMHRISGRVTWCYDNWFNDEEKSGSVVLDLHIHDLDFLRHLLGEPDRKKMTDESSGINISNSGPYYTEDKYFLTCLRENRRIERAPLEEGTKSVLLGLKELVKAKEYVKQLRIDHRNKA